MKDSGIALPNADTLGHFFEVTVHRPDGTAQTGVFQQTARPQVEGSERDDWA
jgi:hypothetical protein